MPVCRQSSRAGSLQRRNLAPAQLTSGMISLKSSTTSLTRTATASCGRRTRQQGHRVPQIIARCANQPAARDHTAGYKDRKHGTKTAAECAGGRRGSGAGATHVLVCLDRLVRLGRVLLNLRPARRTAVSQGCQTSAQAGFTRAGPHFPDLCTRLLWRMDINRGNTLSGPHLIVSISSSSCPSSSSTESSVHDPLAAKKSRSESHSCWWQGTGQSVACNREGKASMSGLLLGWGISYQKRKPRAHLVPGAALLFCYRQGRPFVWRLVNKSKVLCSRVGGVGLSWVRLG